MKPISAITLSALTLLLMTVTSPAAGGVITYDVILSGAEAVPANLTAAFGSATVTVDDFADTVSVVMSWTGLIGGPPSAAHIHCCVPTDANGPVVIPFTGFPTTISGTYSNTFTGVSLANIAGIEGGLAYINIHNAAFPGGEIRGDIVPEPASYPLMGLGVLALVVLGNRRSNRLLR